CLQHYNYPFTF
nr:immunoglobulin light chain junction region [Macaca mulatta]